MNLDIIARRIELFPGQPDPEPIRLRTLILLRWAAITGQLAAVCGGLLIGVRFPLVAVLTIIALAAVLNLLLMMRPNRRISALEVAWQLGFDLAQVAALLALTGGLTNPFALLLLAPVTIAATTLPGRQLKLILAWCELHKDELMQNWELARTAAPLNHIAPLI